MNDSIRGTVGTVLVAGVLAGTIDIGAASVINGLSPLVILRAVASGLLGNKHSRAAPIGNYSACCCSGACPS